MSRNNNRLHVLTTATAASLVALTAAAVQPPDELPGHQGFGAAFESMGAALVGLGVDVDRLGQNDYAVGVPRRANGVMQPTNTGAVFVVSRENPSPGGMGVVPLRVLTPPPAIWIGMTNSQVRFGQAMAVADIAVESANWGAGRDGRNELIVGCGAGGAFVIYGFEAATGNPQLLGWEEEPSMLAGNLGVVSIDAGADFTFDGVNDIAVGAGPRSATNRTNHARVFRYDGRFNITLWLEYEMTEPNTGRLNSFGTAIAAMQKTIGAGLAVGHPSWWDEADGFTFNQVGAVWLLNGSAVPGTRVLWDGNPLTRDDVLADMTGMIEAYFRGNRPLRNGTIGMQCPPAQTPFQTIQLFNSDWGSRLSTAVVDPMFPDAREELLVGSASNDLGPNQDVGTVLALDDTNTLHNCQGPPFQLNRAAAIIGRWNGAAPGDRFGTAVGFMEEPTGCSAGDHVVVSAQNSGANGAVTWHTPLSFVALNDETTAAAASAAQTYTPTSITPPFLPGSGSAGGPRLAPHYPTAGGLVEVLVGSPLQGFFGNGEYRLIGVVGPPPIVCPSCVPMGFSCGDCDQDGFGPTILDALFAAQMAGGSRLFTCTDLSVCNVEGPVLPDPAASISIADAITLAQIAAAIPGVTANCCVP